MRLFPAPALAAIALFPSLAPAATAQTPISPSLQSSPIVHAWNPLPVNTGPFGRALTAELTGDRQLDAVVLDGLRPVVLESPARHNAQVPLDVLAHDICIFAAPAHRGQSRIICVGPGGATRHGYNEALGEFVSQRLDSGAWTNARYVHSTHIDGLGQADLVGLDWTWRRVIQLHHDGTGWSDGPSFTIPHRPHQMLLGQWDADVRPEIIMRSGAGLVVYDLDGTLQAQYTAPFDNGTIAVLHTASNAAARDHVVWAYFDPMAEQGEMVVLAQNGVIDTLDLGPLDVISIAPADIDGDGDDDVVLSTRTTMSLWAHQNRSPGQAPHFNGPGTELVIEGHATAPSVPSDTNATFGDFDWDGDLDLIYAQQQLQATYLFSGNSVNASALKPSIGENAVNVLDGMRLHLHYREPAVVHSEATHLAVRVWKQSTLANLVGQEAHFEVEIPLAGWPLEAVMPLDLASGFEVYSIEAEVVHINPQHAHLRRSWPAYIGAFAVDPPTYRAVSKVSGQTVVPIEMIGTPFDNRETGGFVPKDTVSPFDKTVPSQ